jgi:hypothetical protein
MTYVRTLAAQSEHNTMIMIVAQYYLENKYMVKADHIGWSGGKPPEVNGRVPDLEVKNGQEALLIEIETAESCLSDLCLAQLLALTDGDGRKVVAVLPEYRNTSRNAHIAEFKRKLEAINLNEAVEIRTVASK